MVAIGAFGVLLGACPSVSPFACEESSQCDRDDEIGVCIDGDCAYDDQMCPGSGLKFSPNAGDRAGECVPAGGTESTGTTDTSSSSADDASSGDIPTCGTRRIVELDAGLLGPTSLPGYPALVVIADDPTLAADVLPDASDVWFADESGDALPHEIDAWDPDSGTLSAWVRLPGWTIGTPLVVALHAGDPEHAPEPTPAAVWDSFSAVWHLGDALSDEEGEVVRDSSAALNHGFALGGMSADQLGDGVIGRAFLFDGVDDVVDVEAPFVGTLESFTVSWWARIDGDDSTHQPFFQALNGTLYPRCRRLIAKSGSNLFCQVGIESQTLGVGAEETELPDGEIRHFALTYDGKTSVARLFASGAEVSMAAAKVPGPLMTGTEHLGLGRIDEFGTLLGMLDEFRIAQSVLPPEWIAADVRVQGTPSNLILGVDPPEPVACP
jgi:hypothetical protein